MGHIKKQNEAFEHTIRLRRVAIVAWFGACTALVAVLIIALMNTAPQPVQAAIGINEQFTYQARLLNAQGAVVPDGTYNIEFKIYQDGTGCVTTGTSPCGGTLKWTESRTDANKVTVRNGYFSVELGNITPFGAQVDWNQDTLWLSINIGGTATTPTYDGEMTPFRRLGATPYALNAKQLGGLDWSKFVQVAPSAAQIDASTLSSLFVNKTGASGNILQLQKSGGDVFVVNNGGNIAIGGSTANATVQIDKGSATASAIKFTAGTTTGTTATDGLDIGITATGVGLINQRESLALSFNTSNTQRLSIAANGNVSLGLSDTTGSLLILDTKTSTGDPTGANGGMYYNSNTGKFRCYQASVWSDCITTVGSLTLQNAYDNDLTSPTTITTTSATKGILFKAGATFDSTVFDVQKASGAKVLTVDTANGAVIVGNVASGTAAAAALYFGDTCTNFTQTCLKIGEFGGTDSDILGLHGAGGFRFQTGYGTVSDALAVTTSGGIRFGVGTAAPGAVLTAIGSTVGVDLFRITDGTATAVDVATIADEGAVTFRNRTDSTSGLRVLNAAGTGIVFNADTTNGRVGIGTAAPGSTLEVNGKIQTTNAGINNMGDINVGADGFYSYSSATRYLRFNTSGVVNDILSEGAALVLNYSGGQNVTIGGFGLAPAAKLQVIGNLSIGFADGTAAPASGAAFSGSVGIGTNSPGQKLDVAGAIQFDILTTGDTIIGVCKNIADGTSANIEFRECNGSAADIAEFYPTQNGVGSGDVVATTDQSFTYTEEVTDLLTGVSTGRKKQTSIPILKKATGSDSTKTIGIISTNPYQSLGRSIIAQGASNPLPVALAGRVPVKIAVSSEPIRVGDLLVASNVAGRAEKATGSGFAIGRALENWVPGSGKDKILAYAGSFWFSDQLLEMGDVKNSLWQGGIVTRDTTFRTAALFEGPVRFTGSATFESAVAFKDSVAFNEDTVGTTSIKAGEITVKVRFKKTYAQPPVVNATPRSFIDGSFRVKDESADGFTIELSRSQTKDITFNWNAFLQEVDTKGY